MGAFRSFLRRATALVTSVLRSVCGHDTTHTVIPGRSLIAASRRRFSDATNGADTHQQPAAAAKRHLYLVLDDRKKDYGIYKLDVDADLDGDVDTDSATAPRCLPHPALIRMEVTEDSQSAQFAATGGCIVATGRSHLNDSDDYDYSIVTILYDIKTPALFVSTHPTVTSWYDIAVPVGNRLYIFDRYAYSDDSFHCMTTTKDGEDAADGEVKQRDWSWWPDSGSSRIGWSDSCNPSYSSEEIQFLTNEIQAHAVHPRDYTIFVSAPVSYELPSGAWRYGVDTFIYDTTGDRYKWRRYGRWGLPFKGQAHYDRQLNKWVGLHVDDEGEGTTGHLCACDVPSSEDHDYPPEPEWVRSMEEILLDDPDRRRVDFKLVYMDERAEYCFVERLRLQGADEECPADGEECVLRLTTFCLKYECAKPDYLNIVDRRARYYKVSRFREDFEAQAFWI